MPENINQTDNQKFNHQPRRLETLKHQETLQKEFVESNQYRRDRPYAPDPRQRIVRGQVPNQNYNHYRNQADSEQKLKLLWYKRLWTLAVEK